MKKFYSLFLFLFISATTLAQGIAIQGIARANTNAAITDTDLTFTFTVSKNDNTVLYSETQAIKTDNFGVFSHIVSTGNPTTSAFNNVDFSITNLKMKVLVVYEGNTIEVYNQTFQYTPYAFFAKKAALATNATNATNADNGVPTGAIMPYIGATAPEGWVLCDGKSLTSITGSAALIALVGDNTPNLQGIFLKGVGSDGAYTSTQNIFLKAYQSQAIATHTSSGITNTTGNHNHSNGVYDRLLKVDGNYAVDNTRQASWPNLLEAEPMKDAGNHSHTVTVTSGAGTETRPNSYGVNYIIKL